MGFGHGKNTKVYVNGYDLTGFFKSFDSSHTREMAKSSVFGVSDHTYLPGRRDATCALKGQYDGAALAVDEVLAAALGIETSMVAVCQQGDSVGSVAFGLRGPLKDLTIDGSLDDVVQVGHELQSDAGRDRLLIHHALGSEVASGQSAAVDGGAQTTNGGVGFLQVPDITGITNLAAVIQDSADGSTGWATILTFAGVTADRAFQRVAISGTVRQFTRTLWTFTGSGSAQFWVGFGRK